MMHLRKWLTRRSARWSGLVALLPCMGVACKILEDTPTWLRQASSWRTTSCCMPRQTAQQPEGGW